MTTIVADENKLNDDVIKIQNDETVKFWILKLFTT